MGPFATQPFGPGQFLRDAASFVVHLQQANFSPHSLPHSETAPGADADETGTGPSIQGDLSRYANSAAMLASLHKAMEGMDIIERHIILVSDKERYRIIDQGHQMAKNRRAGLPFDEARQALAGHQARLANLDKSRLAEDDKEIIEMRKAVIIHAGDCYARCQAAILGVDLPP